MPMGRPVETAQMVITREAIKKRRPAVVKVPSPDRLIFMATALAPKEAQIATIANEVRKLGFGLSGILRSISIEVSSDFIRVKNYRLRCMLLYNKKSPVVFVDRGCLFED
jgi:hypothetical protein